MIGFSSLHQNSTKSGAGFTLIELLVVVIVLGMLATASLVLVNPAEQAKKGKDTQRKHDLSQIRLGLESYFADYLSYPVSTSNNQIPAASWGSSWQPYLAKVPQDPLSPTKEYAYVSDGNSYQLYSYLERENKDPQNCQGCGPANAYFYEISSAASPIAVISTPTPILTFPPTATPMVSTPTPTPPSPTSIPTPTPTPTPVLAKCSGLSINDQFPPTNSGERVGVKPAISSWDNVSKVEVREYLHPQPLSPPFTEERWRLIGTITRTPVYNCLETNEEGDCIRFGNEIVGYKFEPRNQEVDWITPAYPGWYYLGMEVYDTSGKKVSGWNTGETVKCTQIAVVRAYALARCDTDDPVYPSQTRTLVAGNNLLLQWQVGNSNGEGNDQAQVFQSQQAGFTSTSSNRAVSRFKADATSVHDALYGFGVGNGTYFYKVSGFGRGGMEGQASTDQGSIQYQHRSCNLLYGPPGADSLRAQGNTFTWEYNNTFVSLHGWYLKRSDGVRFDIPNNEVTTRDRPNWWDWWKSSASWTMPSLLPGTYTVQAYGRCGGDVGGESNSVTVGGGETGSVSTGIPSNVAVSQSTDSVNISWQAPAPGGIEGFHAYRSKEPLDLGKSTSPTQTDSFYQNAYFKDLSSGKHHLAVKVSNSCGQGWSNYSKVDIP